MIRYHTSTRIWLSLEQYYNRGITPKQIEDIIKAIDDPFSSLYLRCQPMGINGNLIVEYLGPNGCAQDIVDLIESAIEYRCRIDKVDN
jgi:hypothetical protein